MVHALDLLGAPLSDDQDEKCVPIGCSFGAHQPRGATCFTFPPSICFSRELRHSCIDTLKRCQHPGGGFGGGPGQLPHLAPTYASVNTLAILGPDALQIIDR